MLLADSKVYKKKDKAGFHKWTKCDAESDSYTCRSKFRCKSLWVHKSLGHIVYTFLNSFHFH